MTQRIQKCDTNDLLKTCGKYLSPCNVTTCWSIITASFHRNPKGISASCHGCEAPGVIFHRFTTSAPDGSDLDVMVPAQAGNFDICGEGFAFPLHLANRPWGILWTDSDKVAWGTVRSSLVASRFHEPEHCPDYCTEMGLPTTISDPGGARNGGSDPPPPCGNWCIDTAGSSNTYNPLAPGTSGDPQVSDGICYKNSGCDNGGTE